MYRDRNNKEPRQTHTIFLKKVTNENKSGIACSSSIVCPHCALNIVVMSFKYPTTPFRVKYLLQSKNLPHGIPLYPGLQLHFELFP